MFDKIQNQLDWLFNASLGEIINQFIISTQESFQDTIIFFGDGAEKLITLRYLDLSFTQTIFTILILVGMRKQFKEDFQIIDADKLIFERIKLSLEEDDFKKSKLDLLDWLDNKEEEFIIYSENYRNIYTLLDESEMDETEILKILEKKAKKKFFYRKPLVVIKFIFGMFYFFPFLIFGLYSAIYDLPNPF
ncbi:hypothetical protein N9I63_01450 [Hyphomicrobiales bacterium]|nr:hypothetical protein [Hyphomicrobiales bacterium]